MSSAKKTLNNREAMEALLAGYKLKCVGSYNKKYETNT